MVRSEKEKYTLAEAGFVFGVGGLATVVVVLIGIPLSLAFAYIRTSIWNWFAPIWNLPPMSIWGMWVIGLFVGTFKTVEPAIKQEYLQSKIGFRPAMIVAGYLLTWLAAYCVHLWWRP